MDILRPVPRWYWIAKYVFLLFAVVFVVLFKLFIPVGFISGEIIALVLVVLLALFGLWAWAVRKKPLLSG